MTNFVQYLIAALVREEEGQTATEYALILALVAVAAATALALLVPGITNLVTSVTNQL